ncbi:MAG: hypothetical protein ACXACF_07745 [Candidatus Hermodarchaeia archaeon]|jgi:hypothetical protein
MTFGLDRFFQKEKEKKKPEEKKEAREEVEIKEVETSESRDWHSILEETVKSMVLYPHLLDYTRTNILPKRPSITPEKLAVQLRVPLGVAMILLDKLRSEAEET